MKILFFLVPNVDGPALGALLRLMILHDGEFWRSELPTRSRTLAAGFLTKGFLRPALSSENKLEGRDRLQIERQTGLEQGLAMLHQTDAMPVRSEWKNWRQENWAVR
jgi:hypothetical protein